MRAVLVAILIATPALLVPGIVSGGPELILLLALIAAVLTFLEYNTAYPSIVEFRDAPPLNRIRFIALFATVFFLTVMAKHAVAPTGLTTLVASLGGLIGDAVDFPYSPVRLVILILPSDAPLALYEAVRMSAGVAYTIAFLATLIFLMLVRLLGWPTGAGSFNVWINLPLFDPTTGGDVVQRLHRDARINIILGVLLPFLIPALMKMASAIIDPAILHNPHTLIWTISAWAFLPASIIMRGIAMSRIGDLIEEQRRRTYANAEAAQTV